jgi:hypothetical protein
MDLCRFCDLSVAFELIFLVNNLMASRRVEDLFPTCRSSIKMNLYLFSANHQTFLPFLKVMSNIVFGYNFMYYFL